MKQVLAKLNAVRHNLPPIKANSYNPHHKNRYISLEDLRTAIDPVLQQFGCLITHSGSVMIDDCANMATTFWDVESGESIEVCCPMPMQDQWNRNNQKLGPGPQQAGSAMTYAQRYSICALFGIVAEEDDDGNSGNGIAPMGAASAPAKAASMAPQPAAQPPTLGPTPQQAQEQAQAAGYAAQSSGGPQTFPTSEEALMGAPAPSQGGIGEVADVLGGSDAAPSGQAILLTMPSMSRKRYTFDQYQSMTDDQRKAEKLCSGKQLGFLRMQLERYASTEEAFMSRVRSDIVPNFRFMNGVSADELQKPWQLGSGLMREAIDTLVPSN